MVPSNGKAVLGDYLELYLRCKIFLFNGTWPFGRIILFACNIYLTHLHPRIYVNSNVGNALSLLVSSDLWEDNV